VLELALAFGLELEPPLEQAATETAAADSAAAVVRILLRTFALLKRQVHEPVPAGCGRNR
jgi:hypothetical protein